MPEQPRRYGWEDYLYPPNEAGIRVLRNKLGLTGYTESFNAERRLTGLRQFELGARPELVPRTFDPEHWKAIHHHVFQDVYEWAGEFRTVNIGKGGHGFVNEDELERFADGVLGQVREARMFAGRDRAGVVEGLMYTMQALNIIHPFREANGRTQRILTEHIAEQAGYVLDWARIDPEEQNAMMAAAFEGELGPLHDGLTRATLPVLRGGSVDESPWPTQPSGAEHAPDFWRLSKPGRQVLTESRAAATESTEQTRGRAALPSQQQHEHGR